MHRLIVLNGSIKQVKTDPFNYQDGKSIAEYLEDGWKVAEQTTWGGNLVILLEKPDALNGAALPKTNGKASS